MAHVARRAPVNEEHTIPDSKARPVRESVRFDRLDHKRGAHVRPALQTEAPREP